MSLYDAFERAVQKDLDAVLEGFRDGSVSPTAQAILSQKAALLKKREVWPRDKKAAQQQKALELWIESNDSCSDWNWVADHLLDDLFVGEVRNSLHKWLVPQNEPDQVFGFSRLIEYLGPGPGAARLTDASNFFTKMFASKASATSEYLIALYRSAISDIPSWSEAEYVRNHKYGIELVNGSSWFSVPKSSEIERACATEPSINMIFQKALGNFISDRLVKSIGLDITKQPENNRYLAFIGSISGQLGTIDLKSASDRNSMAMIEYFFPSQIVAWIKLFRSPTCRLLDGTEVTMEMCSSMGNGFTFPLQTALFAAVVAATYKLMGLRLSKLHGEARYHTWGVFGDDIIVAKEAFYYVSRQLSKMGHIVNGSKSFNSGDFRESCGEDYYRGHNIRGVYIRSLEEIPDVLSALNRLADWGDRWSVQLEHTLAFLTGLLPKKFRTLYVPKHESVTAGIRVDLSSLPVGWGLTSPKTLKKECSANNCIPYKRIQFKATIKKLSIQYIDTSPNPAGLWTSFLGGYIRTPPYGVGDPVPDSVIGIRPKPDDIRRWSVRWASTSSWNRCVTPARGFSAPAKEIGL